MMLCLMGTSAYAQLLYASDPAGLVKAMRDLNYSAELGTDSEGDPKITGTVHGREYTIYFYSCTDNTNCHNILFFMVYSPPEPVALETINSWNIGNIAGHGGIADDGSVVLQHFVTLTGGITRWNFEDTLSWWAYLVKAFGAEIGVIVE